MISGWMAFGMKFEMIFESNYTIKIPTKIEISINLSLEDCNKVFIDCFILHVKFKYRSNNWKYLFVKLGEICK